MKISKKKRTSDFSNPRFMSVYHRNSSNRTDFYKDGFILVPKTVLLEDLLYIQPEFSQTNLSRAKKGSQPNWAKHWYFYFRADTKGAMYLSLNSFFINFGNLFQELSSYQRVLSLIIFDFWFTLLLLYVPSILY